MTRPRLLDLFCGPGGATRGYQNAGFHVTGVDIAEHPNYCGDEFAQADALTFPLDGFDVIHASPPCQKWTAYARRPQHVGDYPDLIAATRQRVTDAGVPYVIENIPGAPLLDPLMLCGSMFDPPLDVKRHRLFETSFPIAAPWPCRHKVWTPRFPGATNRRRNSRCTVEVGAWRIPLNVQQRAMGIDWMTVRELSRAVPPAYTEYIGRQLIDFCHTPSIASREEVAPAVREHPGAGIDLDRRSPHG